MYANNNFVYFHLSLLSLFIAVCSIYYFFVLGTMCKYTERNLQTGSDFLFVSTYVKKKLILTQIMAVLKLVGRPVYGCICCCQPSHVAIRTACWLRLKRGSAYMSACQQLTSYHGCFVDIILFGNCCVLPMFTNTLQNAEPLMVIDNETICGAEERL